jgi:hypothetical protein
MVASVCVLAFWVWEFAATLVAGGNLVHNGLAVADAAGLVIGVVLMWIGLGRRTPLVVWCGLGVFLIAFVAGLSFDW